LSARQTTDIAELEELTKKKKAKVLRKKDLGKR
jgi:hypothetical protein